MADLGIRELSVDQMVYMLSRTYVSLINNGIAFKEFPSVMLWGPPGVGKSQGVRQVAYEIENRTGKDVRVTDVRLLLFNPVDLRGIPTANEDKTLAVWLKPQIFQMAPDAPQGGSSHLLRPGLPAGYLRAGPGDAALYPAASGGAADHRDHCRDHPQPGLV